MPVEDYGVLKGKILYGREEREEDSPHYQILVEAEEKSKYRVAINVTSGGSESEILYMADENYTNIETSKLEELPYGFTRINSRNKSLALDYIRGNIIKNKKQMVMTPHDKPGPKNDLNDFISEYIKNSKKEEDTIYVFGSKFGPEDKTDWIFGFYPLMGIHNVHMNQGNKGRWKKDNGIWQDGGILIQKKNGWIAIFLSFLTQTWDTDQKGDPKED